MPEFDRHMTEIHVSLDSFENIEATYYWLRSQLYKDHTVVIITPSQTIYLRGKWKQLPALQILLEMMHFLNPEVRIKGA